MLTRCLQMNRRFSLGSRFVGIGVLAPLCWMAISAPPAKAWGDAGHKAIAEIAWGQMTTTAKREAIALLYRAPKRSRLVDRFAEGRAEPTGIFDPEPFRQFFVNASTWPDFVRGDSQANIYHRTPWHFINLFWSDSNGVVVDRPNVRPEFEDNAVTKLNEFSEDLSLKRGTAAQRARALAWMLHLVGDIHQPLHTSARLPLDKSSHQDADRGGNGFKIAATHTLLRAHNGQIVNTTFAADNLHSYWDHLLEYHEPQNAGESLNAYARRLAGIITQAHPLDTIQPTMKPQRFDLWILEGNATAKSGLYKTKENESPTASYVQTNAPIAKEAMARAGYRLANLLNTIFG